MDKNYMLKINIRFSIIMSIEIRNFAGINLKLLDKKLKSWLAHFFIYIDLLLLVYIIEY